MSPWRFISAPRTLRQLPLLAERRHPELSQFRVWVSVWVAVASFATFSLYQYLRYHLSGHPLRQRANDTSALPGCDLELRGRQPVGFSTHRRRNNNESRRARRGLRIRIAAPYTLRRPTGVPDTLETLISH